MWKKKKDGKRIFLHTPSVRQWSKGMLKVAHEQLVHPSEETKLVWFPF